MSSNGYREMISSYLWLSFHYTSYKPKSGIVFQVHWNHSWLESTFFFDLLAELPYVACDGLAKLARPFYACQICLQFYATSSLAFFPVVCRDCVLNRTAASDNQQASVFPQRKFARGTGREWKTKTNLSRKFPASFRFILLCSRLSIFVLSSVFSPMCRW